MPCRHRDHLQVRLNHTCINLVPWIDYWHLTVSSMQSWLLLHLNLQDLVMLEICHLDLGLNILSVDSSLLIQQQSACLANNLAIYRQLYFCRKNFYWYWIYEIILLFLIQSVLLNLVFGNRSLHWRSSCLSYQLRGLHSTMGLAQILQNRDAWALMRAWFSFVDQMSSFNSWDLLLVRKRWGSIGSRKLEQTLETRNLFLKRADNLQATMFEWGFQGQRMSYRSNPFHCYLGKEASWDKALPL